MSRLFFATLLIASTSTASAVAAPTLSPLKPCYVTVQTNSDTYAAEPVMVSGTGFTPGAVVTLTVDDEVRESSLLADDYGRLPTIWTDSPFALDRERPFRLTVTERDNPAQTVSLGALVSPLEVRVTPRRAAPSDLVRFRGRGFTETGGVYAHYLRRGKLRKTVRLAKATLGECGTFDAQAKQFPFKPPKGVWRVQIDQHRKLTGAGPLINLTIDVRRRVRTRATATAVTPSRTTAVHGPEFGTSGGDEPYLVDLEPRRGGGAVAALVTRQNLTDTPPGDFILRSLGANGVPSGPEVVFADKANVQSAAMALGRTGNDGLAAWDSWEDGDGREVGPLFIRPFDAATAKPSGPRTKAAGGTRLLDLKALGDGYALLHYPGGGDLELQALDADGNPSGEPLDLGDFSAPDVYASPDRDQLLLAESYEGRVAIVGSDGFVLEPTKPTALEKQIVVDAARTPTGDWLLTTTNDGKSARPKLRTLSEDGELGAAQNVPAAGQIAFSGRRGLLVYAGAKRCDGLLGLPLTASGAVVSKAKPRLLTTPANCANSFAYDLELSGAGGRRFVMGWTHSNGDAGHYVYATGVKR